MRSRSTSLIAAPFGATVDHLVTRGTPSGSRRMGNDRGFSPLINDM